MSEARGFLFCRKLFVWRKRARIFRKENCLERGKGFVLRNFFVCLNAFVSSEGNRTQLAAGSYPPRAPSALLGCASFALSSQAHNSLCLLLPFVRRQLSSAAQQLEFLCCAVALLLCFCVVLLLCCGVGFAAFPPLCNFKALP